jgi:hypothetical protein
VGDDHTQVGQPATRTQAAIPSAGGLPPNLQSRPKVEAETHADQGDGEEKTFDLADRVRPRNRELSRRTD